MAGFKVALALGGGGSRGFAHIGVLKVLQQAGIPIDLIVGTSSGALVGAMYAINPDILQIENKFHLLLDTVVSKEFDFEFFERMALLKKTTFLNCVTSLASKAIFNNLANYRLFWVSLDKVQRMFEILLPDITIEETNFPFAAIATDIVRGKEVIITRGSIRKACQSSIAIPGILPPVQDDGLILVDGGVLNAIPALTARQLGADFVIAVDVEPRLRRMSKITNGLEMIERAHSLTHLHFSLSLLENADVVISPKIKNYHWASYRKMDFFIKKGEFAALEKISEIKELLKRKKWKNFWRNLTR